jgi:hypothetical protein
MLRMCLQNWLPRYVTFSTWLGATPPCMGDVVRREQPLLLV